MFTADTGAQVDCVARNQLKRLGLSEQDLLEAAVTLGCANNTKAGVLGAFWGKVLCEVKNKIKTVKVMFYVLKSGGNLLSRNTLRKLGVIDDEFPKVGKFELNLTMVKKV